MCYWGRSKGHNGERSVSYRWTASRSEAEAFIRGEVLLEVKMNPGKKGEILRREELYQNDIKRYDDIAKEA